MFSHNLTALKLNYNKYTFVQVVPNQLLKDSLVFPTYLNNLYVKIWNQGGAKEYVYRTEVL